MVELHYSISLKGRVMKLHGQFRYYGSLDEMSVEPSLVKAIDEKWHLPFNEIERVECYYYLNGKEITIKEQ